jgi:hypothetical protein
MKNTIALGSIYLFLFYAFASGIELLVGDDCSDWLESCPGAEVATMRRVYGGDWPDLPDDLENR